MKWNLSFAMEWVFCFLKMPQPLFFILSPLISTGYISQAKMKKEIFATSATICRVICPWTQEGVLDMELLKSTLGEPRKVFST